ncbi:thiamine pyrophosphate-binding protein [Simiduia sp. 21SJ11W-1]|uniref:thiamine pyrophosphate-binding protein n=1 Tax=Simiduia sp. 21SJ11W-1 TaxID=2909669 RepID=UPI00209CBFE4|nr:thiamine pyrophosphate-binding protein [Simiduia sp. 21SJ11W-1]UTA46978.1 thiamine pyrophosphate-binding protein [Simiduia sp. 21SJ11W-1]
MKKTGAWLVRYALEQLNIRHTFGIPGVHNTEIYDELDQSEVIEPVLVTHEGCGAFMADAVSRTSGRVGVLVIVPAAGATHAASGIGEAFLDGIPMLIICGGVRSDSQYGYQLHELDQHQMLAPITKATYKIASHAELVPTLFEAYNTAISGEPGPVFVEVPVNIQLDLGPVDLLPQYRAPQPQPVAQDDDIAAAARMLAAAKRPGLFLGWGALGASEAAIAIAECLNAPVATTLQGLSVFPGNHRLHTGMSFGPAAVPAATEAFKGCDCLLAVGTRFAEIGTASFGVTVPEHLIHLDINPAVFNVNYKASLSLEGDAAQLLPLLASRLRALAPVGRTDDVPALIARHKQAYQAQWFAHNVVGRVNPAKFFAALRARLADTDFVVADDGNHTFLTAELMPIHAPGRFISPTDFNCMGYAVPAVIGAKLANPQAQVVGIIGDGAFLMTAMELVTAKAMGVGAVFAVFNDGELSQISQAQQVPYNRKTCTELRDVRMEGIALATGVTYLKLEHNEAIEARLDEALAQAAKGVAVLLDVYVDYSKKTRFTEGIVRTNLNRLPLPTKVRMITRALWRRVTG